ncbi:MAG TPA: TlpA disulfide reductase family protein [Thiobacillaceae bacterium]|nr:TlpA disulfide reductase family protein [Thiobacillaceae bacterium]
MRAFILLLSFVLAGCGDAPQVVLKNGDPAPAFRAETLAGSHLDVPAALQGKVLAIRFWADWCPYCEVEMRDLEPVYRRLKDQGLEVLAVNVAQDRATAAAFVAPLGIGYPVLLDPDGETARRYGVKALPITWFVDRQGRLAGKILGEATPAVFEAQARALLEAPDGR